MFYHIKGKIIGGKPVQYRGKKNLKLKKIKVQFNKSLLSTEIALKK